MAILMCCNWCVQQGALLEVPTKLVSNVSFRVCDYRFVILMRAARRSALKATRVCVDQSVTLKNLYAMT
jgi:hypothetical protein